MHAIHEGHNEVRVPDRAARVEIRVSGSRFLAEVSRVGSAEEAEAAWDAVRRRERDATHHTAAWRIDDAQYRALDDGEPAGSAGRSILRQIDARRMGRTLVVVTRWFGGTKLGVGGLRRAYGRAAAESLEAAGVREEIRRMDLLLRFAYADTAAAMHVVRTFGARILETRYADDTSLTVAVARSQAKRFTAAFADALSGRGHVALARATLPRRGSSPPRRDGPHGC